MGSEIDFVLPWVDGNDQKWKENFQKYASTENGDNREIRFRTWGLLKYWFRSVEKYTPWVRKIHFITSGELPDWLNINHPKLHWVKHEDYIPSQYLPTFSSHTIELNMHRIEGLSDRFVYFNDDFFVIKPTQDSRFFKKNLPCDYAVLTPKPPSGGIIHIAINNLELIEKHFDKRRVINSDLCKWINPKYGSKIMNNILLYPWREFSGFIDPHIPQPFLKGTFEKAWLAASDELDATCRNRFRTNDDVNQWFMRYWQLAEGKFIPYDVKRDSLCKDISDSTIDEICSIIENQTCQMMCINDSPSISDFESVKMKINNSFEKILPQKSSFEI